MRSLCQSLFLKKKEKQTEIWNGSMGIQDHIIFKITKGKLDTQFVVGKV
jgi:hypothetical protein